MKRSVSFKRDFAQAILNFMSASYFIHYSRRVLKFQTGKPLPIPFKVTFTKIAQWAWFSPYHSLIKILN